MRRYPDYVLDPIKNAQMQKMHNVAEYQVGGEFTERYFDRMEILLGIKQEQPRQVQERPVTNAAPGERAAHKRCALNVDRQIAKLASAVDSG